MRVVALVPVDESSFLNDALILIWQTLLRNDIHATKLESRTNSLRMTERIALSLITHHSRKKNCWNVLDEIVATKGLVYCAQAIHSMGTWAEANVIFLSCPKA